MNSRRRARSAMLTISHPLDGTDRDDERYDSSHANDRRPEFQFHRSTFGTVTLNIVYQDGK